jgi:2-methylcitrate dehydratase PrpD
MVFALGLAGSQASGLWAFLADGASCKTLNPARAAVNGCLASLLAHAGVTGPERILTAKDGGMYAAMSDDHDPAAVSRSLGSVWQILRLDKKPYPCCRSTHPAIDAAIALREKYGVFFSEIEEILAQTYEVGWKQCGVSAGSLSPKTAVEAKFSTPYTVACALVRGCVSLAEFTSETINDATIRALLPKVKVEPSAEYSAAYPSHWGCRLSVKLKDGRCLSEEVRDASGSVRNPLKQEQLREKAIGLLVPVLGEDSLRIADSLASLRSAPELPRI